MPQYKYVGDAGRYYVDSGMVAHPGDVADLDDAPADGLWVLHDGDSTESDSHSDEGDEVVTRDTPAEPILTRDAPASESQEM